jgi:cell division transport system permease protein
LQATEGVRDLLAGLPGNPLPDTLIVKPSDPGRAAVAALKADLERVPGVAAVEVDAAWVERLEAFTRVFGLLTASLAAALALAVIAVTFNTIRLQVLTRARELEVAALLGATSGWLRRPFLYFGTLQGIAAGLLSVLLIRGFVALLNARLDDLIAGFGIGASPVALRWEQALTAVLLSAGLGWLGAWLSVSRHLGRDRPGPG